MSNTYLQAGLAEPTLDSQHIFRVVLDAMANPGRIHTLANSLSSFSPLMPATAAIGLLLR